MLIYCMYIYKVNILLIICHSDWGGEGVLKILRVRGRGKYCYTRLNRPWTSLIRAGLIFLSKFNFVNAVELFINLSP